MGTEQPIQNFAYYTQDTPRAELELAAPEGYRIDFTRAVMANMQSDGSMLRGGLWKAPLVPITEENVPSRERFVDAVAGASDAFWATFAKSYPEVTTGDLDFEVVRLLRDEMTRAARHWLDVNHSVPYRGRWDAARIATFSTDLLADHQHNGWSCDLDMVGTIAWLRSGSQYQVYATPDYESTEPTIEIQVIKIDGSVPHCESIPWPLAGRTCESYMALVKPILDKWSFRRRMVITTNVPDDIDDECVVDVSSGDDELEILSKEIVEVRDGE